MQIQELYQQGLRQLAHLEYAEHAVTLLLTHILSCKPAFLKAHPEQQVELVLQQQFLHMIARCAQYEPVAYIIGETEFWNFTVKVSPSVLIPRQETEILVEQAIANLTHKANQDLKILDLCTGSGIIAIALALEFPQAQIFAIDNSFAALEIAKHNININNISNITLLQSDLFAVLDPEQDKFNAIISNPPYIAADDPHLLNPALSFEPAAALIAEAQGFAILAAIIAAAPKFLLPDGVLLLEHGYQQAMAVQELFKNHHYSNIQSSLDLLGHLRVTSGFAAK